jgi:hypothetical protein
MPFRKPSRHPVPPTAAQRDRVQDLLADAGAPAGPSARDGRGTNRSLEETMAHADRGSFWREVGNGLRHLIGNDWPREDQAFAGLLDVLVRGTKLKDDLLAVETDAPAVSTRDPQAEEAQLVREELATARADLPDFETALVDAWQRSHGTTKEVPYSTTEPTQDRAADVLIRYLVTTDVATVRSEEKRAQQYVYHLAVDWTALFELAEHAGVALRPALERHAGG